MRRLTPKMVRLTPWLRAATVLYLLGAVLLMAVHQHPTALHGTDCALCTMSHTPAVLSPASSQTTDQAGPGTLIPVPHDRGWTAEFHQAPRTRAPPQG